MSNQKEAINKSPSGRVKRTPVGTRNILTVNGREAGFHYRIVNDEDGGDRIQQFLDAGYDFVQASDVTVGDKRVNKASPEGAAMQISVGGGKKAYLMRIKQDWYDEDQLRKQKQVDDLEAATKQKALDGTYGKIDITRD